MGIGGAFIMPATLSIITNVFPARERGKAIAIWAATAGVAAALGPLTGGFLLEHFYWGSVFLVNIPVVVFGLVAGFLLIPDSKDPSAPRLDPVGAVLSMAGLSALLYGVIQGPEEGWTSGSTLVCIAGGLAIGTAFFVWERHCDHPMLDLSFFRNPRFSAASAAITMLFLAMFGSMFLISQYLQFVIGYSPLETGVRLLSFALPILVMALSSSKIVEAFGAKITIALGLTLAAIGMLLALGLDSSSGDGAIVWRFVVIASGLGFVMAPATDSIMGSLPLAKAGVGSAVNDTARQVGGAVGVAVIGSVFASVYGSEVVDDLTGRLPATVVQTAKHSLGAALDAVPPGLVGAVKGAFVDGMHAGLVVSVVVLLIGAVVVLRWLPARARTEDVDRQHSEYDAHQARLAGSAPEPTSGAPVVGG
jgi:EmrB/QacA subfamily drug resistance transporter